MENACKCCHHKVMPLGIALIGVLFLLGALNVLSGEIVNITWPAVLIVIGLAKLMGTKCKCC